MCRPSQKGQAGSEPAQRQRDCRKTDLEAMSEQEELAILAWARRNRNIEDVRATPHCAEISPDSGGVALLAAKVDRSGEETLLEDRGVGNECLPGRRASEVEQTGELHQRPDA